ncbi:MAG TPA: dihydropteroate synthase [Flavitalea sp.]|nr:dihydropteroate synthase [Flavitalea sp.]
MFTLNCKGRLVALEKPLVMGILNITPDSFYQGSRIAGIDHLLERAGEMIADGAAIIDVGAQSTRPDSTLMSMNEELDRVLPAIESLHQAFPQLLISVDTFYAAIARESVHAGASFVNDISAGSIDEDMLPVVAALNVPFICMHMKGTPQTMKSLAQYDDIVVDVFDYFIQKIYACNQAGIKDIIIDPGFGFAKNIEQNFRLLRSLNSFQVLGRPVLAGLSRKSTIYKTLGVTADEALNGTTVMNTLALQQGVSILRVHDVREAIEAIKLVESYKK